MCSILAVLNLESDVTSLRRDAIRLSRLQQHRGPDWSGVYTDTHALLVHERLAIVDVLHGAQPLLDPDGSCALAVNGEIYNHRALREELQAGRSATDGSDAAGPTDASLPAPYIFQTDSDCEVILALYREHGADFLDLLNGIFAFVLYDAANKRYIVARDPIGVMPLYMGSDDSGNTFVASEMKALVPVCASIREFPPGHVLDSETGELRRYYAPVWREYEAVADDVPAAVAGVSIVSGPAGSGAATTIAADGPTESASEAAPTLLRTALRAAIGRAVRPAPPWSLRAIVSRDEKRMVGFTNFHGPPGVNDLGAPAAAEIGYTVFPQFRRRGYATETCRALIEWARREHGVQHFISGIEPSNGPSIRVVEKLGFTPMALMVDGECIFELRLP